MSEPYMNQQWWEEYQAALEQDASWDRMWTQLGPEDRDKGRKRGGTAVGVFMSEFWSSVRRRGVELRAQEVERVLADPPPPPDWLSLVTQTGKITPAQIAALRYWAMGLTQSEAARVLGISRSAYRARLERAQENVNTVLRATVKADGKTLSQVRRGKNRGRATTGVLHDVTA